MINSRNVEMRKTTNQPSFSQYKKIYNRNNQYILFIASYMILTFCTYTTCYAKIVSKEDIFKKIIHGIPLYKLSFDINKFKSGTTKNEIVQELGTPSIVNHELNSWYYINIEKTHDMLKINTKYNSTVIKFIFSNDTDQLVEIQKIQVTRSNIPKISKQETVFKTPVFQESLMSQLKFIRVSNI